MSDQSLEEVLAAATWVPKVVRDNAARLLLSADPTARDLLAHALGTGAPEAVGYWRTLLREHVSRDSQRRLTLELQRHLITVAGARSVRPSKLAEAIDAILSAAGPANLEAAQQAVLQLGRGLSLTNAHGIYVSAARKAPPEALPSSPPHLDGPTPELSVFETVELAIDLAQTAQAKKPTDECAELIQRATRALALVRAGKGREISAAGRKVPDPARAKGPVFTLARAALMEAWNTDHVSGRGTSIKSGVVAGFQLGEPAWWLTEVDEAIMRCDARTAWERRGQTTSSRVVHCVWRGGDKTSRFWLGRLESGRYALLSKLGRTWSSTEGDLDSVAATLPDAWFAKAMPAIQSRRSP